MVYARIILLVIGIFSFNSMCGFGTNLLMRPYDTLLRPEIYADSCYQVSIWAQTGIRPGQGFDHEGHHVGPFAIFDDKHHHGQDALAMLEGFSASSPQDQLRASLHAVDDGQRGHIVFDGKLELDFGGALGSRWFIVPNTWLVAVLPFYRVQLKDVTRQDLTADTTLEDLRVHELLTSRLDYITHDLGQDLFLGNWRRTGFGDLNLFIESLFNFPQARAILKNVQINGRCGFTFPTGLKADEDKLLAFPFGYDGAVGLLFGGGLNVTLGSHFKAGLDVQLLHLFGNSKERRIKTAFAQSDFLLLAKTKAYKDFGLTQRFNLFMQGYHLYEGFSLLLGYQYLKHGRDKLQLYSCEFNNNIANTAHNLAEWTAHSVEANFEYEWDCGTYRPQASLFLQLPFNGKRSILFTTVGLIAAIDW